MFRNSVVSNCTGYRPKHGDICVTENNTFITEDRSCNNCSKFIAGRCTESALFGLIVADQDNSIMF